MAEPLSPPPEPTLEAKSSLRWDTAQRACRDGDLKTLKWLFDNGHLFENRSALREACISGAWGSGRQELLKRPYSTTDSIRLHTMLQTATTRAHVEMVMYLLEQFPAKDLHIAEWEVVVNAIAKGSVELLEPFVKVDPGLVNLFDPRFGSCFTVLFELVYEEELHLPVVEFFELHGANFAETPNILSDAEHSTREVRDLINARISAS
ncbi:hypothetical protein EJ08DRAFT_651663 [Tothia fuscella]|uniref:Ankyrin repeat protein n=1 Tax=Tothia fuscella TaxID=1048955 RepID=A0A9P4NLU1_9PEZI|nr:hypothetical protein EJ08DRAFT_651663 [Tothia fuscella]